MNIFPKFNPIKIYPTLIWSSKEVLLQIIFIDTTNYYTSPSPHPYTKGMPLIESILKEFKNNPSNKQLLPRDNHV